MKNVEASIFLKCIQKNIKRNKSKKYLLYALTIKTKRYKCENVLIYIILLMIVLYYTLPKLKNVMEIKKKKNPMLKNAFQIFQNACAL